MTNKVVSISDLRRKAGNENKRPCADGGCIIEFPVSYVDKLYWYWQISDTRLTMPNGPSDEEVA